MKKFFYKKILKNGKKGYTLMYTLLAMVICCSLVLSTITISTYYNNNLAQKSGARGAIFSAQSGIEVTEDYINYYFQEYYGYAVTPQDLYNKIYDLLDGLAVTSDASDKSVLVLHGYANYNYSTGDASGVSAQFIPSSDSNISYKTYYSKLFMEDIKRRGELTILSLGEYVHNGISYYKFITVKVLIQPIYEDEKIKSFDFKTIQYNETLKGGTNIWGSVQW